MLWKLSKDYPYRKVRNVLIDINQKNDPGNGSQMIAWHKVGNVAEMNGEVETVRPDSSKQAMSSTYQKMFNYF